MINYLEKNEKKKPAKSEDVTGSSWSARSLDVLGEDSLDLLPLCDFFRCRRKRDRKAVRHQPTGTPQPDGRHNGAIFRLPEFTVSLEEGGGAHDTVDIGHYGFAVANINPVRHMPTIECEHSCCSHNPSPKNEKCCSRLFFLSFIIVEPKTRKNCFDHPFLRFFSLECTITTKPSWQRHGFTIPRLSTVYHTHAYKSSQNKKLAFLLFLRTKSYGLFD